MEALLEVELKPEALMEVGVKRTFLIRISGGSGTLRADSRRSRTLRAIRRFSLEGGESVKGENAKDYVQRGGKCAGLVRFDIVGFFCVMCSAL